MWLKMLLSGYAVLLGVGVTSHFVVQRILRGHQRAIKIPAALALLLLNAAVIIGVPVSLGRYYDVHYNTVPNPEVPGPIGSDGSLMGLAIFAFFVPVLCGYALYLASLFFGWLLGFKGNDV